MVSIVMPTFNDELFIKDAVSALLNQNYSDYEVIVVNDGSSDSTGDILRQFNDKKLTVITNVRNLGIPASRNVGIDNCTGEFIFITDSDCIVDGNWIRNGLESFEDKETIGVEGKVIYYKADHEPTFSDMLPGGISNDFQFVY